MRAYEIIVRIRRNKEFVIIVALSTRRNRMTSNKRLARALVEKRLTLAWHKTIEQSFGLNPKQAKQLVRGMLIGDLSDVGPQDDSAGGKVLSPFIAMILGDFGKHYLKNHKIRTEDQLAKALEEIKVRGEQMPTMTRKALKAVSNMLPRRGGPGRQPKLNPREAAKACDHIAMFIRQKHSLKEALKLMSDSSTSILGKPVGTRTLQKAWDKRDQL